MTEPPSQSAPAVFHLALRCNFIDVRQAATAAHQFLAGQGCGEDDLMDCELALVEACNNAIKYAPEDARNEPVLVDLRCSSSEVELRVTDHTRGFDWPEEPTLPSSESESGRGLYLIRSVMNYTAYFRGNSGNTLVLRRARSGAQDRP